ncbi:MAG: acyltransferase family protein [Paludibacteraceae bacterium]|nr:acyltransferase family protein [Paludibacteraceae bacterium]
MGNRDVSIDMCKGLGMLLVVLGHLPFLFCSVIYSFHMGFFFILSGWCFSDRHLQNGKGYFFSRFIRLFVPYLIMRIIAKLAEFLEGGKEAFEQYHLIGTSWFLVALFGLSILSWFAIKVVKRFEANIWILPLLFFGLALAFDLLDVINITIIFSLSTWCYFTFYFLLGYCLKNKCSDITVYKALDVSKYILLTGGSLVLTLAKGFIPTTINDCTSISFLPYAITTIIGSYITLSLVLYLKEKNVFCDFLSLIGRNNMSILLLQWPCISLIEYLFVNEYLGLTNPTLITIAKFLSAISIPVILSCSFDVLKNRIKR